MDGPALRSTVDPLSFFEHGPKRKLAASLIVRNAGRGSSAEWVGGQPMTCTEVTVDHYDRRVARCSVNGTDLATWMVSEGLAAAFRRYANEKIKNEK